MKNKQKIIKKCLKTNIFNKLNDKINILNRKNNKNVLKIN